MRLCSFLALPPPLPLPLPHVLKLQRSPFCSSWSSPLWFQSSCPCLSSVHLLSLLPQPSLLCSYWTCPLRLCSSLALPPPLPLPHFLKLQLSPFSSSWSSPLWFQSSCPCLSSVHLLCLLPQPSLLCSYWTCPLSFEACHSCHCSFSAPVPLLLLLLFLLRSQPSSLFSSWAYPLRLWSSCPSCSPSAPPLLLQPQPSSRFSSWAWSLIDWP